MRLEVSGGQKGAFVEGAVPVTGHGGAHQSDIAVSLGQLSSVFFFGGLRRQTSNQGLGCVIDENYRDRNS